MAIIKVEKLETDEAILRVFETIKSHPEKFVMGFGGGATKVVLRTQGGILARIPRKTLPYLIAIRNDYLLHLDRDRYALVGWEHAEQVVRNDFSFDVYGAFD